MFHKLKDNKTAGKKDWIDMDAAMNGDADARFSQRRLEEIARTRLPQGPHVAQTLDAVDRVDVSALMTALIVTDEFGNKLPPQSVETLVSAALLSGAGNFEEISGRFDGVSGGIAHEMRSENDARAFSASARRLFLSGMVAELETSSRRLRAHNGVVRTADDFDSVAELLVEAAAKDADRPLLERAVKAYNHMSDLSGHTDRLTLSAEGKLSTETKFASRSSFLRPKDAPELKMKAPDFAA